MFGAILGDIIGSPYEFDCNNIKTKDFPLFSQKSHFTDDTVMTLAVAKAFMDTEDVSDEAAVKANLVASMRELGAAYPDAGYGGAIFPLADGGESQALPQLRQRFCHACFFRGVDVRHN